MGCLFALFAGFFPRFGLFIIWIARPALVNAAFDTWILPLLGIIFLPFTTLIYVVLYTPGIGLTGWDWFWVSPRGDARHRSLGGQRHPAPADPRLSEALSGSTLRHRPARCPGRYGKPRADEACCSVLMRAQNLSGMKRSGRFGST